MKPFRIILSAVFVLAVILAAGVLAGCAKRTPEQTVSGFFKAIEDGNYNKARTYITNRMSEEAGDSNEGFEEMSEPPPNMPENPWTEENLVSEITGDTARVWHKDFSAMKWVLKQEGGQWKIDDMDFDMSGMMDDLDIDMPDDFEMPEGMEMPEGFNMPGD